MWLRPKVCVGAGIQRHRVVHARVARHPIKRTQDAKCWTDVRRSRLSIVALTSSSKAAYEVASELVDSSSVKLTVTVPAKVCQRSFHATVDKLSKTVVGKLKGFREGRVPLPMIVERVGGQKNFKAAIIEDILMASMEEVMKNVDHRPVPNTEKITTSFEQMLNTFDPAKPLEFEVRYDFLPPVTWLKPYSGVEIEVDDVGNQDTDKAAAEDLINQYRKMRGSTRVVADRGLQAGDVAIIDLDIRKGKTSLPGLKKDKFQFDTEVDPLGLSAHLVGMRPGERRDFRITFPADWHVEIWRGMAADVSVAVSELFTWVLPEFDDAFVKEHYPGFDGAEDLRSSLVSTTALERTKAVSSSIQDAIIREVTARTEVEVPDSFIEEVGGMEYRARLTRMVTTGGVPMAELEAMSSPEMFSQFLSAERESLAEQCRWLVAVDDIFTREALALDEGKFEGELEQLKAKMTEDGLEFEEDMLRDQTREQFKAAAVMDWLQRCANINVRPWRTAQSTATSAGRA